MRAIYDIIFGAYCYWDSFRRDADTLDLSGSEAGFPYTLRNVDNFFAFRALVCYSYK